MLIRISKQLVFKEVEKRSSLEGYIATDQYKNIWADSSRGELLESFWIEGYTAVVQLMKKYIKNSTLDYSLDEYEEDEVVNINAEMPKRYNSLLDGSIATDIRMMVACNILHGWMEVVYPSAAPKYQEEADGYAEDLRVKLLYRQSPESDLNYAKTDLASIEQEEYPLIVGRADSEEIIKNEEKLESAKYDSEEINKSEEELESAKFDSVEIRESESFMDKPKEDNIPLIHSWGCCKKY
jgi:hypothetical protein